MMKTVKYLSLTVGCILFLSLSSGAIAGGAGFFLSSGSGWSEFELDYDNGQELDYDDNLKSVGIGFIIDTGLLSSRTFNYRLSAGFEHVEYQDYDIDLHRIVLDHTFGFAVIRTNQFRTWVGPQIRSSYSFGDDNITDYDRVLGFGIGINIGTNMAVGPSAVLSFDSGYRFTGHGGDFKEVIEGSPNEGDFSSLEGEAFFKMSFMFQSPRSRPYPSPRPPGVPVYRR